MVLRSLIIILLCGKYIKCTPISDYWIQRENFLQHEANQRLGSDIQLNDDEQIVNKLLMKFKQTELNSSIFLPGLNFLIAQPLIEQSPVFKFIQKMPKGAALHVHDSALASEGIFYNLTFMEHLYFCNTSTGNIRFRFAKEKPKNICKKGLPARLRYENCTDWKLLSEERQKPEANELNNYIKSKLTLAAPNSENEYCSVNAVWEKFRDIFSTVVPLVTYRPALEVYWKSALKEYYNDNVLYLEFRGTVPNTYDLNGTKYSKVKTVGMYRQIFDEFKEAHPDFHGGRLIYGPTRQVTNATFNSYEKIMLQLHKAYPDFVAGFDLVGQEDLGEPLSAFVNNILSFPDDIKFFFHSGETKWYGETDLNLIDALLMGTSRIGHGYAIHKHPYVKEKVKEDEIAIEVNPISNQVLCLVEDLRNHPAAALFAENFPLVIASDDPGYWKAKGLSYDFYQAFIAFSSVEGDLRVLKKLALNSIQYSSLSIEEQAILHKRFNKKWTIFINEMKKKIQ